jgi:hypothetical protein
MSDANGFLISTLPDFLTWQAGNDLTRSACKIHVQYVYHQVKQWSSHSDTDLFPLITSLPASSQQRLLLAPRLYTLLRSKSQPGADEISSLRQFLEVEKFLCNQDGNPPRGSWTALCDFYFAPDKEVEESASSNPWFQGDTFRAPRLGSIVLDAYRPFTNIDYPPPMGDDVTNHTAQELEFITWRIEQSLEQIRRISRTARSAVDALLQVITVVRAPKLTKGTQSFSNKPAIGRMGLANANSNEWSVSKIADAIVHEAVHALIYKIELTNCLYNDYTTESAPFTAISPWSGRKLRLHSFLHACFVWFGLWNFWGLASRDEPEAVELRGTAARGFLTGHPLSHVPEAARDLIRPEVRQAIDHMFKEVTVNVN